MNTLKSILPYILCIILGFLLFKCTGGDEPKTITRTVTVKVPEIINHFDTIYKPVPAVIRKTDTIILKEFLSASDSLKIAMYINATKEREYKETFTDTNQTITVSSKVRGTLLEQTANYKIFERTITKTDTIELEGERNFYLLPQAGYNPSTMRVKASGSLIYQDKKNRLYSLGYNSDGFVLVGYGLKL